MDWRQQGKIWQLRPSRPLGQVDFIGGSYLAATPQVSYRRLLDDLSNIGLVINAWAYVPGFDHQSQAREAWSEFRTARKHLEERYGPLPLPLRLGHSLGCKLQLLAPHLGRLFGLSAGITSRNATCWCGSAAINWIRAMPCFKPLSNDRRTAPRCCSCPATTSPQPVRG